MKAFIGMLLLLFFFSNAWGEEVLTLKDCEEIALKRFPSLRAAEAQRKAAERHLQAVSRQRLPRLYGAYAFRFYRDPERITTPFGSYPIRDREEGSLAFTVRLPVFHGLAIPTKTALARLGVKLAEVEESRLRQELLLKVREAFFQLIEAEKRRVLAQKSWARIRAHLADVEGFFEEGLVARNQVLHTRAELREAEHRLVKAENAFIVAQAALNLLLVRPLEAPLKIKPVFPGQEVKQDWKALVFLALKHRPEVKAARLALSSQEKELRLVRSRYFPWLDLEAQYYVRGDSPLLSQNPYMDRENAWIGLRINWEIWDWGVRGQEAASIRAKITAAEETLRQTCDQISFEVRKAYADLVSARKRLEAAQEAVSYARENFRLERARFREGLADTTDVLDAETLLTKALTQEIAAKADYEIARARLAYAVGVDEIF